MLTVHLRINDSSTGQPTPVRLRISGTRGEHYHPLGRMPEFPKGRNEAVGGHLQIGNERWYYIDGACEVVLPAGVPLRIQAEKGPEYQPLDETITLGPGQISLRLTLSRVARSREPNSYSADLRCHFLAPHIGLLEAMAEDLNVVYALAIPEPLLASDGAIYTTVPDLLAFSGQNPALAARPNHYFLVNTLNAHPVLGKIGLLHSHRVVFPLTFGGVEETDDWSLCDWCDQCHRKRGLTIWVDAFAENGTPSGGEALAAAILGKINALELTPQLFAPPIFPWLYRLWDAGILLPLVGASGKDSNQIPLGLMRTYANVPGEFSLSSWVEALRSGFTYVTSSPLLEFRVNGHGPGTTVETSREVVLSAKVRSLKPFERLEIVAAGKVIASKPAEFDKNESMWFSELQMPFSPTESFWVAARCTGTNAFAHTSPIVVRLNSQPLNKQTEAVAAIGELVRRTIDWAETYGRYANAKRKEQLIARCREAIDRLKNSE